MVTVCYVGVIEDTSKKYGPNTVKWVPFDEDQKCARKFAEGKGVGGKNAKVILKDKHDPAPKSGSICIHEAEDWGDADAFEHRFGELWAIFTCIHCKRQFYVHAGSMVGK